MPSNSVIRAKVRDLNRLNTRSISFETIKGLLDTLTVGMTTVVGQTPAAELFYRARINPSSKPLEVEQMMAPPATLVRGFQRCNAPGLPMFYSASKRITALLECHAKLGDIAYLSQWMAREPAPINKVLHPGHDAVLSHGLSDKDHILHSYLDTLFTRKIHETFSDDYKFTAALTELLTTRFKPEKERDIRDDGHIGLRYPSVVDVEHSYDTVFHPGFARHRLDIVHAMEIRIERSV